MNPERCIGCRDDFYNGKNPYGIENCWGLMTAKLVMRRRVAMDERPPWRRTPEEIPSCYREAGYVFVDPAVGQRGGANDRKGNAKVD